MKITRNILDNGKRIVHIQYTSEDIKKAKNKKQNIKNK
jgi:hypothetical protein